MRATSLRAAKFLPANVIFGCFLFILASLAAPVSGHGETHHHPNVYGADHRPTTPTRGSPVAVEAELVNKTNVTEVHLIYCRVQHYACGPALNMTNFGGNHYSATIPWTSRFFKGVNDVGYRLEIVFDNQTTATSPQAHYPYRPAELPAEADTYYYYALPAESPSGGFALTLMILVLVGLMRR